MSFNATAKEFVPRVNAPVFSPASTTTAPTAIPSSSSPPTTTTTVTTTIEHSDEQSSSSASIDDEKQDSHCNDVDEINKAMEKTSVTRELPKETTKKKSASKVVYEAHDKREHLNIVFIGHVDAGKSTISGNLLYLTGHVDKRTIEKYEREAKEKNRESWYFAYVMDTNEEERSKGKTVEVGRAQFSTDAKRYTILDAPGHKKFVPNMITGTAQADVGVLVISARKGEFETGFDRGGQTREHAMLAKTLGVERLVILINKMDDQTVMWSKERYDFCVKKLSSFLKSQCGFDPKKAVWFLPCSGITGANLLDTVDKNICSWYDGESLVKTLDSLPPMPRDSESALRIPIVDRYKEMGCLHIIGKVEVGTLRKGMAVEISPVSLTTEVLGILVDDTEVDIALPGENVVVRMKGIDEDDVHGGMMLCDSIDVCPSTNVFEAQMVVSELLDHKPLITAGYGAVLHVHSLICECEINQLIKEHKKGKTSKRPPQFVRTGAIITAELTTELPIPIEVYKDLPQLARFTLRDEGKTIAIGKVVTLKDKIKK